MSGYLFKSTNSVSWGYNSLPPIRLCNKLTLMRSEHARTMGQSGETGFFDGKVIRSERGASARITAMMNVDEAVLKLDRTEGFRAGDR